MILTRAEELRVSVPDPQLTLSPYPVIPPHEMNVLGLPRKERKPKRTTKKIEVGWVGGTRAGSCNIASENQQQHHKPHACNHRVRHPLAISTRPHQPVRPPTPYGAAATARPPRTWRARQRLSATPVYYTITEYMYAFECITAVLCHSSVTLCHSSVILRRCLLAL